jgi:ribonuclease P protein component
MAVERLLRDDELRAEKSSLFSLFTMLPKKNRLPTTTFDEVIKSGKRADSFLFSLTFLPNSEKTAYSAVVSKKVGSTAVKRNALRRRIYEILHQLSLKNGLGIVFAKKNAGAVPFVEAKDDLEKLLAKCDRITK